MLELFLNTVTRRWYDKDGDPFGDGMPQGAYLSREDVKITLCKETPDAGATGVDVSTWTRDDSLASVSGVGAMLTIDSDRIHKLKGELSGEVSAGAVSTITATIENASNATVPASGTLRLFDETGDYEAIAYTDRSIVDGEATFTVSGSVSVSYAVGSVIDCDQSPYAQAYLDTSASNLEQGELVFYLVIDSQRLRAEMDYSDVETLSIAGLELLIYRTADGASEPVTAYLCETYSVTGTLGSVGNEAQPPDATEDKLAGLVDQLLAAGLDVEQQYDSERNTQFRVRSVSAGGTWSDWITVQKGEPGEDGKSFSVDATGLMSERSQYDAEAAGFSFLATDEGNLYIKNSDSSGDWSDAIPFQGPAGEDGAPGPANTLTIGTVTTGEPGTQAAASITGVSPNQVLNLNIPRGDKGETGPAGSGSGDMLKSVYDTDNDGKVDEADQADFALNVGGKTASQVASAVDNSHTHSNKTTLDKLGESGGKLTFDGAEVGGGTAGSVAWDDVTGKPSDFPPADHSHEISDVTGLQSALDTKGTVKSVNGVQPDSSGNVTIETGSSVDESRLLPDPSTLSSDSEGNVVAVTKLAADANTIRLMHFNTDFSDSVTGDSPVSTTNVSLQEPGKFGKSLHFDGNPPSDFYYPALSSSPDKWTIDFWAYLTQYMNSQASLFVFGTVLNEADITGFRVDNTGIHMEVGYHNSVISGGESVSLNEWHHIAVTYADNTYNCYLDGNLYASQSSEKKVYFTKNLWLGSYFAYNSDHTMRGMIDEFRISNIVRWDSNFTPPDKEYEGGMLSYAITDPDEIMSVDAKIATHNASIDTHPMQGATTNDYNGLDTNCSWYLSYGDNTSNVNAPANGPFFVMTKKWTNSSETAGAGMQIAVRNMTGSLVNQAVYIRTWSVSSGWRTWQKVGSSAMAGTPDYGAGVNIVSSATSDSGYTCTSAGWIMCYIMQSGVTVTINGNTIDKMSSIRALLPVASGDIFKASVETTWTSGEIIFYPNR